MGESLDTSFVPGWYPEPGNSRREGYWDGRGWTGEWRETGAFLATGEPDLTPAEVRALRVDHSTGPAWAIATSPLWLFAVGSAVVLFSFLPDSVPVVLIALSAFALLALGFWDRWLLRDRGLVATASPFWGFLGPLAYLIARHYSLRVWPGRRSAALYVFLGSILVALIVLVFMVGVTSTINTMLKVLYGSLG